jgi:hypothetical protein
VFPPSSLCQFSWCEEEARRIKLVLFLKENYWRRTSSLMRDAGPDVIWTRDHRIVSMNYLNSLDIGSSRKIAECEVQEVSF